MNKIKTKDIQIATNSSDGIIKSLDFYAEDDRSCYARRYFNSARDGDKEEVIQEFMNEIEGHPNPKELFINSQVK